MDLAHQRKKQVEAITIPQRTIEYLYFPCSHCHCLIKPNLLEQCSVCTNNKYGSELQYCTTCMDSHECVVEEDKTQQPVSSEK